MCIFPPNTTTQIFASINILQVTVCQYCYPRRLASLGRRSNSPLTPKPNLRLHLNHFPRHLPRLDSFVSADVAIEKPMLAYLNICLRSKAREEMITVEAVGCFTSDNLFAPDLAQIQKIRSIGAVPDDRQIDYNSSWWCCVVRQESS